MREKTKGDLFNASRRIADLAPDDARAVEIAYLAVLTRRPTPEEPATSAPARREPRDRSGRDRLTDLFWTLLNTTEFSWNH